MFRKATCYYNEKQTNSKVPKKHFLEITLKQITPTTLQQVDQPKTQCTVKLNRANITQNLHQNTYVRQNLHAVTSNNETNKAKSVSCTVSFKLPNPFKHGARGVSES